MNQELTILQSHTCGECMQCCKLLRIKELNKPAGCWCDHALLGVGCSIYITRPQVCKDFECLWLQEDCMPDELRPDKSHCVLWVDESGEVLQVTVDPLYPEAYHTGEMKRCLDNIYESKPDAKIGIIVGDNKFAYDPYTENLHANESHVQFNRNKEKEETLSSKGNLQVTRGRLYIKGV